MRDRSAVIRQVHKDAPTTTVIKAREVRVPLVDAAILAVASKLSLQGEVSLSDEDEAVLAALRRAHPNAGDSVEELGRWLAEMDDAQLGGVVSHTKGVLHEMRFVAMENTDGDTIYAAQFEATNHAGYDVVFSDHANGAEWVAQLKATSSEAYVKEWLERHPDGEIVVTSELAERLGFQSSGLANAELTADTEKLVDQLVTANQSDAIWDYVPALTALSVAAVVYEMHHRLRRGEISRDQFAWMTARATGKSAARVVLLTGLLSIPGVNIATALVSIANFLSSAGLLERSSAYIDKKRAVMDAVKGFESAVFTEKMIIEGALEKVDLRFEVYAHIESKNDEYREIYWKNYREAMARLKKDSPESGDPVLEYTDPATFIPPEHPHGEVEDLIRAKVSEIEEGRMRVLEQARIALNESRRRSPFVDSLKDFASERDCEVLLSIVEKV